MRRFQYQGRGRLFLFSRTSSLIVARPLLPHASIRSLEPMKGPAARWGSLAWRCNLRFDLKGQCPFRSHQDGRSELGLLPILHDLDRVGLYSTYLRNSLRSGLR